MTLTKKTAVSVLSAALLLGNISTFNYGVSSKITLAQEEKKDELSNVSKSEEHKFQNDDKVKVIVKLKGDVDPNKLKTKEGIKEVTESTKAPREKALKEIKDKGIDYEKLFEYDTLMNGFALETTFSNAKKIQELDFVDTVEMSVSYNKPENVASEEEKKESTEANDFSKALDSYNLINIQPLWNKGYRGQGKVVAVLDSGLDPNHPVLRLSDNSKSKYKTKDEIEKIKKEAGIDYGKWYSEKLPFAFNYNDWNNDIKQSAYKSHGMHVAGTAVGNPKEKFTNGDYVTGIAPEAQLIFMRVFSDTKNAGTESYIYTKAIEDAIKLGADTINLSLGSPAGSVVEVGDGLVRAMDVAKKAGVNIVAAAGNNAFFASGQTNPSAANPDYGTVGRPSVSEDAISVANISNSVLNREIANIEQLKDNADFDNGKMPIFSYTKQFDKRAYDYVYVGVGKAENYADKDLTGKIALIQRGGNSFEEKVKLAKQYGAAGAVIYFNEGDTIYNLTLNGQDKDFPVVTTYYKFGNELSAHEGEYKITFNGTWDKQDNPKKGEFDESTGWGMSVDGYLKPDVTAPGGDILSSYNDGRYGLDSGTSMASPHVAGAITLVKQVLSERFPNLSAEEIQGLAKRLIMSTANPQVYSDSYTTAYRSPRLQGAGLIDANKAAYGDLYVTGENNYGSVSLGNVGDKFTFKLVLHNLSDKAQNLQYAAHLTTDNYYGEDAGADWSGRLTMTPKKLLTTAWASVEVPAKGEKEVEITVDATDFKGELEKVFTNGYYLEGFVTFYDEESALKANIPFVGFKGQFQNLPVLEKPIYSMKNGEKPTYEYGYTSNPNNWDSLTEMNFTGVLTTYKEDKKDKRTLAGAYVNPVTGERFFTDKIFFSPNGDENYDEIGMRGVFYRNFENLKLSVYAKDDVERKNPLYQNGNGSGNKNFYNNTSKKYTSLTMTNWKGVDNNGNPLPDGEYQYVVSYSAAVSGADMQETTFNVVIDRKAPKITGANGGYYDEATRKFTPYPILEDGSGVFYKKLSYGKNTIAANEDGSYTIPEGVELKDLTFEVKDFADNKDSINLSNVEGNGKGSLEVEVKKGDGTGNNSRRLRYKITNEKGEIVGEDFSRNKRTYQALPFGKYTVEVVMVDGEYKLLTPSKVDFEITKDKPTKEVEFRVDEISRNATEISFDKPVPAGTKVYAVAQDGTKVSLPASLYGKNAFQKNLENGTYTIQIVTPEGYTPAENNFELVVKDGHNKKQVVLNVAEKVASVGTTENSKAQGTVDFTEKKLYNNYKLVVTEPTAEEKTNIQKQLTEGNVDLSKYDVEYFNIHIVDVTGKEVKVPGDRSVTLDLAKAPERFFHEKDGKLTAVNSVNYADGKLTFTTDSFSNFVALTPKNAPVEKKAEVNKVELQKAIEADKALDGTKEYKNATIEAKDAYNKALEAAKKVLENENATQEEVNSAVASLNAAKVTLANSQQLEVKKEVDKAKLIEKLKETEKLQTEVKFKNAGQDKKDNFVNTIKEATAVLDNKDATVEEVTAALEKLQQAENALDGKEVEAPKPAAETPKKEESKPAAETPKKEEPKPAVETPKKEEPKPVVEEPKKEEPKPVVEEPKKEEPKPVVEEPKKEEPKPAVEEPKKEEPKPAVETPKEEPKPTPEEPKKKEGNKPQPETPKVDKKKLNEQLSHLAEVKEKDSFESASAEDRKAYLDAVQKAQELLASATATQEEVDKALEALKEAEKKVSKKSIKDILGGFVGKETKKESTFNVDEDFGKVSKSNSLLPKTGLDNNATAYAGIAVLALVGLTVYVKRRKQK